MKRRSSETTRAGAGLAGALSRGDPLPTWGSMTQPLVVSLPHRLGKDEAVRRLKGGLGRAAQSFPVLTVDEETWSGDIMSFRVRALGQAASGTVDVQQDHVVLTVTLPWLLQKFADLAQTAIRSRGTALLEKK